MACAVLVDPNKWKSYFLKPVCPKADTPSAEGACDSRFSYMCWTPGRKTQVLMFGFLGLPVAREPESERARERETERKGYVNFHIQHLRETEGQGERQSIRSTSRTIMLMRMNKRLSFIIRTYQH